MAATVFLMTDVVGSTALWEAHRDEMPDALALHDSIVHGAVGAAGGRVFKHTGDGMLAAFSDTDAAVEAVRNAISELAVAEWGPTGPLRIRSSLDAGTASERDGDFFGPPVNRVARINSIVHPDQVVISQVARGLMRVPSGVDLGEHQLRDLAEPVRLWQLDAGEHPPLTTLARARHNLPSMPTEFIGRRVEVGELRALLAQHRLVTIVGVGGAGKTRLAIEAASASIDVFPGGVWFADLTPERDGAKVGDRAVAAMGLTEVRTDDGADPVEALRQATEGSATLLVLDNCEHIIDDAAELCAQILARAPSLTVLATSRESLAVDGERAWRIPGLENEAVELFVTRAEAAGAAHFDLDRVDAVCAALDHIPLAIELAAAKLRSLSLADIADRLDDRFQLLDPRRRRGGSSDREQTLRAMMDWSYGLLDEGEQLLLDELSVFSGSFALDGVEAVATPAEVTVLGRLEALVAQSLVTPTELPGRYRLLETVRLYGHARLDEHQQTAAVRDRHLSWARNIAGVERGLEYANNGEWEARLEAERQHMAEFENLVAAMEWAQATGDQDAVLDIFLGMITIWSSSNRHVVVARQWLDRIETQPAQPTERAHWLFISGIINLSLGDFGPSVRAFDEGVELAEQQARQDPSGDWWVAGSTTMWIRGALHAGRGEYEEAMGLARRLHEFADRVPHDGQLRHCALCIETDVRARRRAPSTLATSRKAVDAARTLGAHAMATTLALHASILLRAGLDEEALEAAEQCLDAPAISVVERTAQIMIAAVAHARCGRFNEALAMVRYDLGPMVDAQRNHHRGAQLGALVFILAELDQRDRLTELARIALAVGHDSVASYHRHDFADLVGGEDALDAFPEPSPEQLSPAALDKLIDDLLAQAAEFIDSR